MKEVAADLAIVIGPAVGVYDLIGDPGISVLWSVAGISVGWYECHLAKPQLIPAVWRK